MGYTIKHLYGNEFVHGKEFPMNSIVLSFDNKIKLVGAKFIVAPNAKLEFYVWLPTEKRWFKYNKKDVWTNTIVAYYKEKFCNRDEKYVNYAAMMRHDRRHKKGGMKRGKRGAFTDYECSNNPMHDFRRVYR